MQQIPFGSLEDLAERTSYEYNVALFKLDGGAYIHFDNGVKINNNISIQYFIFPLKEQSMLEQMNILRIYPGNGYEGFSVGTNENVLRIP